MPIFESCLHHLLQHVKTQKMIKAPPWLTTMAENYKLFFSLIFIFLSSSLRQLSYFEYIFLTSYRMNMILGLLEIQLIGVQLLFSQKNIKLEGFGVKKVV